MENIIENSYEKYELREQLYLESKAMAEYALANGCKIPTMVIKTLESYARTRGNEAADSSAGGRDNMAIENLVSAHFALARIIGPAKPSTILLLDKEEKTAGFWKILGPVPLIRQMMAAAIISLVLFIGLSLFDDVRPEAGNMLLSSGIPLLLNLLFYLAAAALGASFSALYKANTYLAKGTFDPTYNVSYWTRFFLGVIAGLVLAVIISDKGFHNLTGDAELFEEGILRPLLAMLGGFSADLVYTILQRLVETFESLFNGSDRSIVAAKTLGEKNRLKNAGNEQRMKVALNLMDLQQKIGSGAESVEIRDKLSAILSDLLPDAEIR